MQTAWPPDSFARADARANFDVFEGYVDRAPFPHADGARRFEPRVELELEPSPTAAAEARAAIGALDGRADPRALDDVRLLISELVTNAVRHAGLPAGATIQVAVLVGRDAVRAEVADTGGGFEPAPRSAPWTEAGGWGLHVVDSIASRWGVDRHDAVRVWFEIDSKR